MSEGRSIKRERAGEAAIFTEANLGLTTRELFLLVWANKFSRQRREHLARLGSARQTKLRVISRCVGPVNKYGRARRRQRRAGRWGFPKANNLFYNNNNHDDSNL